MNLIWPLRMWTIPTTGWCSGRLQKTRRAIYLTASAMNHEIGTGRCTKVHAGSESQVNIFSRFCRTWSVWLFLWSLCLPIFGIDRDRRLDQLLHTSWTAKDGAPGDINAIVQTTDGYLWLGTGTGLYRFDGVRFSRYQSHPGRAPSASINSLLADPEGGLWIGFGSGSVSFLKNGKLIDYHEEDGLGTGNVRALARDQQGTIWAASTSGGLFSRKGSRWEKVTAEEGFSGDPNSLFVDKKGALWVGTKDNIFRAAVGDHRFHSVASGFAFVSAMAESPDGKMWMANFGAEVAPIPDLTQPKQARPGMMVSSFAILFDNQGSLWVTSHGGGLYRVPQPNKLPALRSREAKPYTPFEIDDAAENYTQAQGLSNDAVKSIFQDREGNIWTGTATGLDRFRQSTLVTITFPPGTTQSSLTAQPDGSILAASTNKPLLLIKDGKVAEMPGTYIALEGLPFPKGFGALITYVQNPTKYEKTVADGNQENVIGKTVLVGTTDRPRLLLRTKLIARPQIYYPGTKGFLEATSHAAEIPGTVVEDSSGRCWFSLRGQGVLRSEQHGWTTLESLGGPSGDASTSFTDSAGRIWFGFPHSVIAVVNGNNVRTLSEKDGLNLGNIYAIQGHDSDFWVAGFNELAFFDGARFHNLLTATPQAIAGIKSMAVTSGNGIWLTTSDGVLQIPESEVRAFHNDARHPVQVRVFDREDGLLSHVQTSAVGLRNSASGTDGRLYFATDDGLVWADPARIPHNDIPPLLAVESLTANGTNYNFLGPVNLAPRTSALQIHYVATSLSIPERVRFRYKLDGVDRDWQDADTRRDAYYTNLDHGSYTFHVIACNDDGVWNNVGTAASFYIAPAFYQTWWFRLFYIAIALVFLWSFYLYRLGRATVKVQERFSARMEERERIARELHDTLLQGFQGLVLRFQAIMKLLPADQPAHQMMENVLDRADQILLEGRQSVRDIREEGTTGTELSANLLRCGEELALDHTSTFSLTVIGEAQAISPVVFNDSYRIAREALINAFQHSNAIKIEVEITYTESGLWMRIRDDGKGIDASILGKGRSGHWGLSGMRERARKMGAQLAIWSHPGAGTEIDLRVPADVAYFGNKQESLWQRFRHTFGERSEV